MGPTAVCLSGPISGGCFVQKDDLVQRTLEARESVYKDRQPDNQKSYMYIDL